MFSLDLVFELIDMRSFSNLWYWIGLAVLWSSVSHWVLGVPFDMVQRARRRGGQALIDFEALARININRLVFISQEAGLWMVGLGFAILTALALLGFVYGVEFAQAVFLLLFPMSIVAALSMRAAHRLQVARLEGEALARGFARHRFWTQVIGVISIFVTAMWGMYQNFTTGALGG